MTIQKNDEKQETRRNLPLLFTSSWLICLVCGVSSSITAIYFYDIKSGGDLSWKATIVAIIMTSIGYGLGAFVLGTLTPSRLKKWTKVIIYISPFFLFKVSMFALAYMDNAMMDDLLNRPLAKVVAPLTSLIITPFVAYIFINIGEESAGSFSRPRAMLNIPWQHWLWMIPFFIAQVISVPLFLLLLLWKIDLLAGNISLSIFNLPAFISRIIVFFILILIIMSINSAYTALSEKIDSTAIRVLKVSGVWVLLSLMQAFIFLSIIGNFK